MTTYEQILDQQRELEREHFKEPCHPTRCSHSTMFPGAPTLQGIDLFEVYEADGSLLLVTSALDRATLEPGDRVYRRAWATAAVPTRVIPSGVSPPLWCDEHMEPYCPRHVIPPVVT